MKWTMVRWLHCWQQVVCVCSWCCSCSCGNRTCNVMAVGWLGSCRAAAPAGVEATWNNISSSSRKRCTAEANACQPPHLPPCSHLPPLCASPPLHQLCCHPAGDFFWSGHGREPFPKIAEQVETELGKYKQVGWTLNPGRTLSYWGVRCSCCLLSRGWRRSWASTSR